ncbi:hypothetical protein B7486_77150, partial [cyanobacterium TDX16]
MQPRDRGELEASWARTTAHLHRALQRFDELGGDPAVRDLAGDAIDAHNELQVGADLLADAAEAIED